MFTSTEESTLQEKRPHKAVPSLAFFSSSSNRDTQSADFNTFEDASDLKTLLLLSAFLATMARALRIARRISASLVENRPCLSSSRGSISCNVGVGPAHVATRTRVEGVFNTLISLSHAMCTNFSAINIMLERSAR